MQTYIDQAARSIVKDLVGKMEILDMTAADIDFSDVKEVMKEVEEQVERRLKEMK